LLGLLDADGTLANDPPNLHMCNRELLLEVQLLARTVGVVSRLQGPYVADRRGHVGWRLAFAGSLLRHHLGYGAEPERFRYGQTERLTRAARERFLDTVPVNAFAYGTEAEGAFYVLRSRMKHGGDTTNPHTVARMYAAAGETVDPTLYTTARVVSAERTNTWSYMHTLSVFDSLHRYDSAGIVSKNSTAADIMNLRLVELNRVLKNADPTALLIAQVHDAIYVECDEKKRVDVERCMQETLSSEVQFYDDSWAMPFPFDVHSADNWYKAS
jgi:hypothetical protein